MTPSDEPPFGPEFWIDETGKQWRLRSSGVYKGTRRLFMRPDVRVMVWSYRAQPWDALPGDREEFWKRVVLDVAAAGSAPPPCGLLTLDIYTDGQGGNLLLVREPRW